MQKRVILTLLDGSFEQGFPVVLRAQEDSLAPEADLQIRGKLPPAPEVLSALKNWHSAYTQMVSPLYRIKPKPAQVTNYSCRELGSQLVECLNHWLNSGSREWQRVRDGLQQNLRKTDEIQLIVETRDIHLRRLPWHLWDLLTEHYTRAEVALGLPEYEPPPRNPASGNHLQVLAVLGDSTGVDVQKDQHELAQIKDWEADLTFLVEPQRQALNDHLWEQQWDILFFAGHSCSREDGEVGQIYINQVDSLSIDDLRYALRKAVENGLKLAIFNSCDGLGLACKLADLHIPQIIVMREPVPDRVAQEFLKGFLKAFATGKSLYQAVQEARQRLQVMENEFPCASWLPVICQNPAAKPATWNTWCRPRPLLAASTRKSYLPTVLLSSLAVAVLVAVMRLLGVMQPWELKAYDWLMQLRPEEGMDSRLLVVAITEADLQLEVQKQRKDSLSDAALTQLLDKLSQLQPRAIGLDLYRDRETPSPQLVDRMKNQPDLFAVCKVSEAGEDGTPGPEGVPDARQGFSDVLKDADGVLRRHLVAMELLDPSSPCTTPYALSAQLAFHYLGQEGIEIQYTDAGELQIDETVLRRVPVPWYQSQNNVLANFWRVLTDFWRSRRGGYQRVDTKGYQLLLNYRSAATPSAAIPTVTLSEVLAGQVKPELVRDRVVLIGDTVRGDRDDHTTPYSAAQQSHLQTPGVIIQAQMVSQILSAVKDKRPLLTVWPLWGDLLWVGSWALVGGLVVWQGRSRRLLLALGMTTALGLLWVGCWGLFIHGLWVPLVPAVLALLGAGVGVGVFLAAQDQQKPPIASERE